MAQSAAAVSQPVIRTPPVARPPARGRLSVLPGGLSSSISKTAAERLFAKFAKRSPLPAGELRRQLIPDSTWKRSASRLGPTAAQTVGRLTEALAFATRTWQNESEAVDWLLTPHQELAGATPYAVLRTESGGRSVTYLIAALEYGFPV